MNCTVRLLLLTAIFCFASVYASDTEVEDTVAFSVSTSEGVDLLDALTPTKQCLPLNSSLSIVFLCELYEKVSSLSDEQRSGLLEINPLDFSVADYTRLRAARYMIQLHNFCHMAAGTWCVAHEFDYEIINEHKDPSRTWKKSGRSGSVAIARYEDGSIVIEGDGVFRSLPNASWDDKDIEEWVSTL